MKKFGRSKWAKSWQIPNVHSKLEATIPFARLDIEHDV